MATARLQRFRLDGIRDTGVDVGSGSYAVVKEFDFRGLKCVGKEIHSLLYGSAAPRERADMLKRFEEECELLGRLHHPNIVQFLGVHVRTNSGLPALVMEYLPTTLSDCVDRHGAFPAEISLGILRDVALGLRYLHEHSPPIIHRDLSANNVLLTTNMSAKISDLGLAKILDMSPARAARMTQTQVPGTPIYMPPETMVAHPKYTSKVDIFSMGVLIVHVLSGKWPIPSEAFTEDPLDPNNIKTVSEFDRRHGTIKKIEDRHPLLGLIRQCLSNIPSRRPDAVEVVRQVREVYSQVSPIPKNRLELLQQVQSLRVELQQNSREEVEALKRENATLQRERRQNISVISSLRAEIERMRSEEASVRDRSRTESLPGNFKTVSEFDRRRHHSTIEDRHPLQRLSVHQRAARLSVRQRVASIEYPIGMSPQTRWQWRKGADAPMRMSGPQAVVMGESVCVGCGNLIFQYDWRRDTWSTLPQCPVYYCGIALFLGRLITVGGSDTQILSPTGKVYKLNKQSKQWQEFLPPMPTARTDPTVITRNSGSPKSPFIISMGGAHYLAFNTVEVYSHASSQWYTANPLPIPCYWMTSVIINDTCYIMGGLSHGGSDQHCFSVPIDLLIDSATAGTYSQLDDSIWMSVSDPPLRRSTAANLRGSLIAIGGRDTSTNTSSSAIHVFTSNGSWKRVREGDLPEPRFGSAAVCLPSGELLVVGLEALIPAV